MSTPEQWIVIDRWDDFQHPDALRTGNLPWLKTFTRLLSDSSYLDLNAGERAVLHGIWLEYARARGQLTVDTASLTRRLSLRVTKQHLESLNHAGFIHFSASKPASKVASSLQAQSREDKNPLTPSGGNRKSKTPERHICPICQLPFNRDWQLAEHLTNVHEVEPS